MLPTPRTCFDTPERSTPDARRRQRERLLGEPLVVSLLDCVGVPAALVNEHREILVANAQLASHLGTTGEGLLGQRVGEALDCVHASESPAGCGTTEACQWCGAGRALRESRLSQRPVGEEARIALAHGAGATVNARVECTPMVVSGLPVTVVVLRDLADQQRRQVLERMFFHDTLNTAGGLRGLMETWPDLSPEEAAELAPSAAGLAEALVEQLEAHRDLTAAEHGQLDVAPAAHEVAGVLAQLRLLYGKHEVARGKAVRVLCAPGAETVVTDGVLLKRILGNLLKNALEASTPGDTVTLAHERDAVAHRFHVHNPGVMGEAARFQVFQRSFSTKGRGRGLGTYGARLFAERYLGGRLAFTSQAGAGTTFTLTLPAA